MLHGTIRHDDFQRNIALQCWDNVVTIRNNVATMLQRSVALEIVVANRLVYNVTLRQSSQSEEPNPPQKMGTSCDFQIL